MMTMIDDLLKRYPIISDQVNRDALALILTELRATLTWNIPGDIVELGCYIGTTSLFVQRVLERMPNGIERTFHVYDSFEGLPEKMIADASITGTSFRTGELSVRKKQLVREFQRAGLMLPVIHKAWFKDLSTVDVPNTIAFAFLDGDFYNSIMASLKLVWPRMSQDGIVLIDDYGREALPGVERAVRDFFQHRTTPALRVSHNIAIIKVSRE